MLTDSAAQCDTDSRSQPQEQVTSQKALRRSSGAGGPKRPPSEVRLVLGIIAYNLGNLLRRLALPLAIQNWSLTSLQQRLFKPGGRLVRHARYFSREIAEGSDPEP